MTETKNETKVPDPNPPEKPKISKLLDIAVDDKGMVYVNWPTDKKELCLTGLCEALKLVSFYQVPEKAKPRFMDFVRGLKP